MEYMTVYRMNDGSSVGLSMNYGLLLKLRSKAPKLYSSYNAAQLKISKQEDIELGQAQIIYTGYVCAHLHDHDNLKGALSLVEFFCAMNQDRQYNASITNEIYSPNHKMASAKRS